MTRITVLGMYLCICNCLKECQVNSVIEAGACTVGETFRQLGCQPVCGKCVPSIRDSFDKPLQNAAE